MIRKAQLKYVLFSILVVLLFFSVVFGIFTSIINNGTHHEIINKLNEIEFSYQQENISYPHDHFVALILDYENQEDYSLAPKTSMGFNDEQIKSLTKTALDKGIPFGSVDNVYYKLVLAGSTPQMIIATDATHILEVHDQNVSKTFWGLLVILSLISLFSSLFSFWVFKPLQQNLYKQRQFLSDVSHELKTPVAIISANADVLSNNVDSEYLKNIKSQSERIGVLVNDLLTLSSLDEKVVNQKKQHFLANEAVLQTLLPFDAVAFENKKFIKFDVEENLSVLGYREDLVKICGILLDNAVKYATPDTEITVSLKKVGKKTVLSVFNYGCEVENHHTERIFERFYRADVSRSRNLGGSGLGLSIAKSLAKRNRWKIEAKPKYNDSMEMIVIM